MNVPPNDPKGYITVFKGSTPREVIEIILNSTCASMSYCHDHLRDFEASCRKALEKCKVDENLVTIAAIGSYGRLEARRDLSDIDPLIIYREPKKKAVNWRAFRKKFYITLAKIDANIPIPYRNDLVKGTFPTKSLQFPMISVSDLSRQSTKKSKQIAMQLLFESQCLINPDLYKKVCMKLISKYFTNTGARLSPAPQFRSVLQDFISDFTLGLITGGTPHPELPNSKVAKILLLREFYYRCCLIATANIGFVDYTGKHEFKDWELEVLRNLTAPGALKVLGVSSSRSRIQDVYINISDAALDFCEKLSLKEKELRKKLDSESKARLGPLSMKLKGTRKSPSLQCILASAITVLDVYENALDMLYSEDWRKEADKMAGGLLAWLVDGNLNTALDLSKQLIQRFCGFATLYKDLAEVCIPFPCFKDEKWAIEWLKMASDPKPFFDKPKLP